MKSKITLSIIGIVILVGTGVFFWERGPHLPRAQMPQAPGTFIQKNQFVFAGYKTPEAAFESAFWAMINGDYDAAVASFPPTQQAEMRKDFKSPKHFKSEAKRGELSQLNGMEIMARKNVNSDKVELKFQMIDSVGTNFGVFGMVKIGNEWKIDMHSPHDYQTNWDDDGNVVTFAE